MTDKIVAGYGTWQSPLTAARVTAGSLRFDHIVFDGDEVYWAEGRASEGGRNVVVRRTADGRTSDVTPAGFDVRTRVHEYGGAAYTVHRGAVYFSNFADQKLYRQAGAARPQPLTQAGFFYAECSVDERRGRLVCVREDHTGPAGQEPRNAIVAVPIASFDPAGAGSERVLASGADFYSDPILSPDGARLAWLQWNHPNMPWDGTELWVAAIAPDGSLSGRTLVAGGKDESIFQPQWSPDGRLYFVSDRTGYWNLYRTEIAGLKSRATGGDDAGLESRATGGAIANRYSIEALYPMAAEFGRPQWTFSHRSYDFITATRLVVTYNESGRWKMGLLETEPRKFEAVDLALEPVDGVRSNLRDVYFLGGSPTQPMSVARMPIAAAEAEILRSSTERAPEKTWISVAEAVTVQSNGQPVHAFYYPPVSPEHVAPSGERPPLIVMSHGGPTTATVDLLDERLQFWTSRGFAVLDVNYSGSTGYGRAYRDRLKGQWGVLDVADSVAAAEHMVAAGKADPNRLIIRGGSAGGYTTLAALTFHRTFKAGASYYGISDIEVLARDTHKFEARYLDTLIGPYPASREVYRQRSPIHHTDRLSCALILFQGLEDKIVPPNQSEMMADAVRRKGLPVAYVPFEGEQHGFRRSENLIRALEAELYFYGAVFGFKPADTIEPVRIENLR